MASKGYQVSPNPNISNNLGNLISRTANLQPPYPFWRMEFSPVPQISILHESDRAQIEHTPNNLFTLASLTVH